jgi:hypothetical protein
LKRNKHTVVAIIAHYRLDNSVRPEINHMCNVGTQCVYAVTRPRFGCSWACNIAVSGYGHCRRQRCGSLGHLQRHYLSRFGRSEMVRLDKRANRACSSDVTYLDKLSARLILNANLVELCIERTCLCVRVDVAAIWAKQSIARILFLNKTYFFELKMYFVLLWISLLPILLIEKI